MRKRFWWGGSCLRVNTIRPFLSIGLACAVRQRSSEVRALCDSDALLQRSHLKLHTSHCTLHTSHVTLRTYTSHPILHLISSHLSSSHLIPSLLICPRSSSQLFLFHPSTAQSNFLHTESFYTQKALTHGKRLHTAIFYPEKLLHTASFYTEAFRHTCLCTRKLLHGNFYTQKLLHRTFDILACTKHFPAAYLSI